MKYETTLSATATLIEELGERADGDNLAAIEITDHNGSVYKYVMAYDGNWDAERATDEALRAWLCDDENSPVGLHSSFADAKWAETLPLLVGMVARVTGHADAETRYLGPILTAHDGYIENPPEACDADAYASLLAGATLDELRSCGFSNLEELYYDLLIADESLTA